MSVVMEEETKRWSARRESALELVVIQGRPTVSEASRQFDIPPSEIESWIEDSKRGWSRACKKKFASTFGQGRDLMVTIQQQHVTRVVGGWIQFYNRRPHQALGMRTPAEAYALAPNLCRNHWVITHVYLRELWAVSVRIGAKPPAGWLPASLATPGS